MANVCDVTGKRAMTGNHRSHANNARKRRFNPNIQVHRFQVPGEGRSIKLRVSAQGLRLIDKLGITRVLEMIKERSRG